MNRALHKFTDEERAAEEAMFKRIMHEAQQFEPDDEPRRWNPIAVVVFVYAAVICFVLGWIAAERM